MRIQHNITAMNSYRNFSNNTSKLNKNLEKLASGYKINRAGDDAAGLAISEKMRAQISGLEGATKNAKDGISLIQTAEGALTEVHDMLNRMVTLAEQSANGTYQDELDRDQLQKEITNLKDEIDRVADSTNYNGIQLLNGDLDYAKETTVVADSAISNISSTDFQKAGASDTFKAIESSVVTRPSALTTQQNAEFTVDFNGISWTDSEANDTFTLSIDGTDLTVTLTGAADGDAGIVAVAGLFNGTTATINGHTWQITKTASADGTADHALKFTQTDTMDSGAPDLNPSYSVQVDMDDANAASAALAFSTQQPNERTQVTKTGRAVGASQQAQIDVQVDLAKLKDGDKLIAGDKTYVFKVGNNSTATATGTEGTIDLTKIFKEQADQNDAALQKRALDEIVNQIGGQKTTDNGSLTPVAGNKSAIWTAGNKGVDGGIGTIHFQSLKDKDESTLHIGGVSDNDTLDLTTESGVMAQFSSEQSEAAATTTFDVDVTKINIGDTFTIDGTTFEFTNTNDATGSGNVAINLKDQGIDSGIIKSNTGKVMKAIQDKITSTMQVAKSDGTKQARFTTTYEGNTMTLKSVDDASTGAYENRVAADISTPSETTFGKGLVLQIGDTSDDYNTMSVSVADMHANALGIGDIDISTQDGASVALDKIKDAVNKVSDTRGNLGAMQNRLEHTINNLGVMRENVQNAESLIRDTDVAEEMMAYTKNNILNQSAQAMLAQANQLPQGVLQLLG